MPAARLSTRLSALLAAAVVLGSAACTSDRRATPPATTAPTGTASSASGSSSASPSASEPAASIAFSDCSRQFQAAISSSRAKKMHFACGKLAVPLDYDQPTAEKVNIFVVRARSDSQSQRIGSLLVNPGGPGGSGVNLAAGLVGALSQQLLDRFDLIGFDPRGVGLSDPLQCISDEQKDRLAAANPDVRTAAGRTQARTLSDAVVASCVAKYGPALGHFNTEETAHDMDLIRQALGDPKLNYLGFSYGTRLGAAYAHQFPTTIRAAVLDGAVDPVTDELTVDERQAKAFEEAFDQFAADCLSRPDCAALGNPRSAVRSLIAAADRAPIPAGTGAHARKATGGLVTIGVASALYNQAEWDGLGQALVAARDGDARKILTLADEYLERDPETGHYSNILDANLAVNCNDSSLQITDELVASVASKWIAKYPIFGPNAAASLYSCHSWPRSGHPLPPASAPGAPPILVVGTVHDPATPFVATGVLAKALGSGVVLRWDGEGHTAYPKTSCITSKVDSYLLTAKPPAAGTSCPRG
ncbi:alpha/beta hydrolase [Jatrophihabitans sp.]|uniref:alpha/beta hydrolase n=1 Tax=Jatrophihabitans sp. TaxID=1932789 RepID=UPI002B5B7C51|nr:alpha/beta hydrolase [Jatrophihabitans sp.]